MIHVDPIILPLVPAFLALRREEVGAIPELLSNGDLTELERIGHNIKGSGAAYGFDELSHIGGALEKAVRERTLERVPELHSRLASYLKNVVVADLDE